MKLRVALAQLDPVIGDLDGNAARIRDAFERAKEAGCGLVLFPELSLPGYPPKDLVEREGFVSANIAALQALAPSLGGATAVIGFVDRTPAPLPVGRHLSNAAAVIDDGRIAGIHRKALLPTYDVFDEGRWFEPATSVHVARAAGLTVGVSICEDVWNDPAFWPRRLYPHDPIAELVAQGAEVIVNISASPFDLAKRRLRPRMLVAQAKKHRRPLLFVNQVGGQDDLLFDGASLAIGADGEIGARGREFAEDLVICEVDTQAGTVSGTLADPARSDEAAALDGLVLGTRDYVRKCGFRSAVIGLSGGIDSALVAVIAARALGPENVLGVGMPSRYSSEGSRSDARALAGNLGIHYREIAIEPMFAAFLDQLGLPPAGTPGQSAGDDLTAQNLQARVRGSILMALSNRHGHMVLSTGNKSEMGVGYCTLYGDMCGGLSVISDVPKTMVYRIAAEVNREREIIPRATIEKPPSAELRPDQTDQDSLPPYDLLDAILEFIVEGGLDTEAIVARGFDRKIVTDVMRMVRTSEYKRKQAAPGLKLTTKAFGPGRRIPIAQGWKG